MKNFKAKNSTGHDSLSTKLIKKIAYHISYPMTVLINDSLRSGKFPDKLKIAKVIPLYKKNERDNFDNYRPISLLPVFSKVFEKIVHKQIYEYFQSNNLFYTSQYGFRSKHSTEGAVVEYVDYLKCQIDNGHIPVSVSIDLSKAFNTLDHSILLKKLSFYGLSMNTIRWFENYLSNRKQFVLWNGVESSMTNISCGVPQGSVLGPLLFIIYINDLEFASKNLKIICFADDSNLTISFCNSKKNCKGCKLKKTFNSEILNI